MHNLLCLSKIEHFLCCKDNPDMKSQSRLQREHYLNDGDIVLIYLP